MVLKNIMKLPELNLLKPTKETTFYKLVEELAEYNNAVNDLNAYELYSVENNIDNNEYNKEIELKMHDVMSEVMDIAQVCSSQLFVLEVEGIDVKSQLEAYKGKMEDSSILETKDNCRYIYFPKTNTNISMKAALNLILAVMGKIAQLSKLTGANGEKIVIDKDKFVMDYIWNLLDIIKCCFELLYSYDIDMNKLFNDHVAKLERRGYCKLNLNIT